MQSVPHSYVLRGLYVVMKMFLRDILANYNLFLYFTLNPSERKTEADLIQLDSYRSHATFFFNSTVQLTKRETTRQHHPFTFSPFLLLGEGKQV